MVTMRGDKNPDRPSAGTVHARLKTYQFILSSANLSRSLTSLRIVAVCLLLPFAKLNLTSWKTREPVALKNPRRNSWTVLAGLPAVEIPSKTKWRINSFSCIICRIGERVEFNLKSKDHLRRVREREWTENLSRLVWECDLIPAEIGKDPALVQALV